MGQPPRSVEDRGPAAECNRRRGANAGVAGVGRGGLACRPDPSIVPQYTLCPAMRIWPGRVDASPEPRPARGDAWERMWNADKDSQGSVTGH